MQPQQSDGYMEHKYASAILLSACALFANNAHATDSSSETIPKYKPHACLVLVSTGQQFCQQKGEEPLSRLPDEFYRQPVYVQAEQGTEVILSDVDNLADKTRKVYVVGTVLNEELKNAESSKGEIIDVSAPASMKVVGSDKNLGCLRNISTDQMYCLPKDRKVNRLPDFIYDQPIEVRPTFGLKVKVSAQEELLSEASYSFEQTTTNDRLQKITTNNGLELNLQKVKSMAVVDSGAQKACLTSRQTGVQFCLAEKGTGEAYPSEFDNLYPSPNYLPSWIRGHEVDAKSNSPIGMHISNTYNVIGYQYTWFPPGEVSNNKLSQQVTVGGEEVDLSQPNSFNIFNCKNSSRDC